MVAASRIAAMKWHSVTFLPQSAEIAGGIDAGSGLLTMIVEMGLTRNG
jgi:hypothetical protein